MRCRYVFKSQSKTKGKTDQIAILRRGYFPVYLKINFLKNIKILVVKCSKKLLKEDFILKIMETSSNCLEKSFCKSTSRFVFCFLYKKSINE